MNECPLVSRDRTHRALRQRLSTLPTTLLQCLSVALLFETSALGMEAIQPARAEPSAPPVLSGGAPNAQGPPAAHASRAADDTTYFGYVDASGFAIPGETWTWDHGHLSDPLEGWTGVDVDLQDRTFYRRIDEAIWTAPESGNLVPPPVLSGLGSAWVGAFQLEADSLCWTSGLGYGDGWNQRLSSPILDYTGAGDITVDFTYFSDSEPEYDYTRVLLRRVPGGDEVVISGEISGPIGLSTDHPAQAPVGTASQVTAEESDLEGSPRFQVIFEFTSDGGWSDEDSLHTTEYGPFAVDDIAVAGSVGGGPQAYDFETDLQGWTPERQGGPGPFMVVNDVSVYQIPDSMTCNLSGNVLALHDETLEHPKGQHQYAVSNPIDLTALPDPGSNVRRIFAQWEQYSYLSYLEGVAFRPGWSYYPYSCSSTGFVTWSPRVGPSALYQTGDDPICEERISHAFDFIPQSAEQVRFIFELWGDCDAFGIGGLCYDTTNESPLLDNVRIGVTQVRPDPAGAPDGDAAVDETFRLRVYPNPVERIVHVSFTLPTAQTVSVAIFDVSGCRIRSLVNGRLEQGDHSRTWNRTTEDGRPVPAGVYWSQLVTDDFRGSKKMIVLD